MKNKIIALALSAMLFALCLPAGAQQPAKLPKIGFLNAGSGGSSFGWRETLVREFGKLGYVEGRNITFEVRNANTKYDRLGRESSSARRKRYRLRANCCPIGRQATGATERDHSQTLPGRRAVE